ncbi:MAG TPA: DUF6789 family protein [Candidatus Thermoplasmatota archaeon]|nr:DUF6789 family protein [Candidatus Thermoplasmatota archaeon]
MAGFLATIVMSLLGFVAQGGGPAPTALLWSQLTGVDPASGQATTMGLVLHFLYGTLMGLLFAGLVIYMALKERWVAYGLVWGLVLWLASSALWTPLIRRTGFLENSLGAALLLGALSHLVYGAVLGLILRFWLGRVDVAGERRVGRPVA